MPKRTFQPKKRRTIKKLGFRAKMSTPGGRRVIKRRKEKGRKILTKSDEFRLTKKSSKKFSK